MPLKMDGIIPPVTDVTGKFAQLQQAVTSTIWTKQIAQENQAQVVDFIAATQELICAAGGQAPGNYQDQITRARTQMQHTYGAVEEAIGDTEQGRLLLQSMQHIADDIILGRELAV